MSMKIRNYENKQSNYNIVEMNKSNLSKLSRKQLVDLLLKDQQKLKKNYSSTLQNCETNDTRL